LSDRVLIKFRHGLGDAVQLTAVLRHLDVFRPEWVVDVAALKGKDSAFHGICNKTWLLEDSGWDESSYESVFDLEWSESCTVFPSYPGSKAEVCLMSVFGIEPRMELLRYRVPIPSEALTAVDEYYERCGVELLPNGRRKCVLLHYEGNTATREKNLSHATARALCDWIESLGQTPIILDWDFRSPIPDGRHVFCPDRDDALWGGYGTGDAARIAALIHRASLFVGIDSGPQKVAVTTETPSIAVWVDHHPVNYSVPSDNFVHLVRRGVETRGNPEMGSEFFHANYRYGYYSNSDLTARLRGWIVRMLSFSEQRVGELVLRWTEDANDSELECHGDAERQ